MEKFKLKITFEQDSNILIADKGGQFFDIKTTDIDGVFRMLLSAKADIKFLSVAISFPYEFEKDERFFCNGYQSWTASREMSADMTQRGLLGLARFAPIKNFAEIFGDYKFYKYSKIAGQFHGYTYGYIRKNTEYKLWGSLDESNGWTQIVFEPYRNRIKIAKDIEGKTLKIGEEIELFNLGYFCGNEKEVFDNYFAKMNIKKPIIKKVCGYTSWYNYFGNISEEILLRDLNGIAQCKKAQIFQIDDGYQSKVGDWLKIKENKFPNGMAFIADKIHEKGFLAGIWLAPTLCAANSETAKLHPEWLIADESGLRPKIGAFAWGKAYILDLEIEEVKQYLREVFGTILRKWNFDMVKLDFLYSECLAPRNNKTRGQIMCETMEFFREIVGKDKLILGCGVPLGACFGKVDMCRIGCDVDLSYKPKFYTKCSNQEILSTTSAINNAIFRRQLDGRAFANDTDVFFLRDNNLHFKEQQKEVLANINKLVGSVLFVSDNVSDYSQEKLDTLDDIFSSRKETLSKAEYLNKNLLLLTVVGEQERQYIFDIKSGRMELKQ